jgi:hypothetical protein
MSGDADDLLRELKGSANGSLYTPTPLKEITKHRRDSGDVVGYRSISSGGGEDPADMMRVLGNEEALFMTLSENGMQESSVIVDPEQKQETNSELKQQIMNNNS